MNPSAPDRASSTLESRTFLLLLVAVTLAFAWILWPYGGAVFWGVVLAIVFSPLYRRLLASLHGRRGWAALATLGIVLLIVILPLALVGVSLMQEAATVYEKMQSGEIDFGRYFERIVAALPAWVGRLLERFGLGDVGALQQKLTATVTQGSQAIGKRALSFSQDAFDLLVSFVVMLYLLFFLLRDGPMLARRVKEAIPLDRLHKRLLFAKFSTVIRATVKGNILVAIAQGALGGLAFWFLGVHGPLLWATLMAVLSLLPAVGAAIVWLPVAVYFLVTGSVWQGVALAVWGVLVIGLIDNVLRPILVGKDTRMPDYVVLVSTIGGMAVFGINGFVIGPAIAAMFIAVWDIFATERAAADA